MQQLLASSFAALPPGGILIDHDTHVDAVWMPETRLTALTCCFVTGGSTA